MKLEETAALVLLSGDRVQGVVQVSKSALEKNPELLERVREDAQILYNQSIIIEENLEEVSVCDLWRWLARMNPSSDDLSPWEEAARWAIKDVLDGLDWKPAVGAVSLLKDQYGPKGPKWVECTSLDDLIHLLDEAARNAWDGSAPRDGGRQVFRMEDSLDVRRELFERCEGRLKELGWT